MLVLEVCGSDFEQRERRIRGDVMLRWFDAVTFKLWGVPHNILVFPRKLTGKFMRSGHPCANERLNGG